MTTLKINFYQDKKGNHGLRIYHNEDITKDFIKFLKKSGEIKSQRVDKNNNFFWLERKDVFNQLQKIFHLHKNYLKLKELFGISK